MGFKTVSLERLGEVASVKGGNDNLKQIQKFKNLTYKAMTNGLTERQRQCIELYYFRNLKMAEVADVLGLKISTVSRHIAAAMKKLKKLNDFVL